MNVSSISVIIPVYQCAERLSEHVESLRLLRPLVHEFIWVITESPDRSHEIAREAAKELGGQILEVARGLYQAWNSGIARATKEFIYISTIGDTITPDGLNALALCIKKNQADMVFSPPVIWPRTKTNLKKSCHWPVFRFAETLRLFAGAKIPKESAMIMQLLSGASGLLGSCASCLFRASFLQKQPFPTDHYHYGDTAWTFRHLHESVLCYYQQPVARFVIHDDSIQRTVSKSQIFTLTHQLASHLSPSLAQVRDNYIHHSIELDKLRNPHPKFGWWWIPAAWRARVIRNISEKTLIKKIKQFH